MEITEIVANRCQILRPKCIIFDFGTTGALPDPLSGFKGPISKTGMENEGRKGVEMSYGKGRVG